MRRRLIQFVVLLCLTYATFLQAESPTTRLGAGLQYGGLFGVQTSYRRGDNAIRRGYGYAGFAFGYDRYYGDNASFGVQLFGNQFVSGFGLNYNHYLKGSRSSGWVLGLDLYRGADTNAFSTDTLVSIFFSPRDFKLDSDFNTRLAFSIGFQY